MFSGGVERDQWDEVGYKQVSQLTFGVVDVVQVFLLLTLNIFHTFF